MGSSLLRQRAVDDAALVRSLALDLFLDAEDVLAAESYDRITWKHRQRVT